MSPVEPATPKPLSLADFLRDERAGIVRDFLALDRRALPSARRVAEQENMKELLDHIPDVLDAIEDAARATEAEQQGVPPPRHDARRHALHRLHQRFSLDELTREYGLLRRVLLTRLGSRAGDLTHRERVLLHESLDQAVLEAVMAYTERNTARLESEQQQLSRARAEADLERSRLSDLFLQAPVAFAIVRGSRYVIELANPLVCRLWGREHAQLIGRPLFEALPEVADQGIREILDGVMTTGVPYVGTELHVRLARAEGDALENTYFNLVYEPLRNTEGHVEGIILVATEVTENVAARKRVETLAEALHASEERLRLVTDAIPYLISFIDADERYQLNNKTYERWFGIPAQSLRGVTVRELSGTNYPQVQVPIRRALQGEFVTFEAPYTYPGNRAGFIEATFIPQRAPDGRVIGFVAVAADISERKQLEAEQRQRAEFEQQLIGIVSHDLRNPISAIAMSAGLLLRRQGLDERTFGGITRILASADRANRMIRDLLDFTQVRLGGGIPLERRPVDLHELTQAVVEEVRLGAPERDILLEHEGDTRGEWDGDRLAQVVTNLVGNALSYSPPDTPVRVRTSEVSGEAVLSIHNEGEPIAPELLPRVFEPLERAVSRPTSATRSIGLGLFIVRDIVQGHGGRIEVRSTRDEGTTFSVFLPRSG